MKETADLKTMILALGETPVSKIAEILNVHAVAVSNCLKEMWMANNFEESRSGTKRIITLTSVWVDELLLKIQNRQEKTKSPQKGTKNTPSEQKEDIEGLFYEEFRSQFSLGEKKRFGPMEWNRLIRLHIDFFSFTTNPKSQNTSERAYKLKSEYIEEAKRFALNYIQEKRREVASRIL